MPYQIPQGIQQYLLNLYHRFDKEPDAVPVLRVEDKNSLGYFENGRLRIENFRLILVPGTQIVNGSVVSSHANTADIDLTAPSKIKQPYIYQGKLITPTITVQEIHDSLISLGFQVSQVEPRFYGVAATILAEVDEVYDGRAFLSCATSVLWRILMPIAREGKNEKEQSIAASRQLDLHLAEGKWLDRIGLLYGLSRYESEDDNDYRKRIDFHVIRPHANNVALEYMVEKLFGFSSEIIDNSSPEWFYTDDINSVTYCKGLIDIKRTPPGEIPFFSVVVNTTFSQEEESPEEKLYRESGKQQWFYLDDPFSTTASFGQDDKANVTPPGNKYYKNILENRDMLLIGTEQERKIYRSILQYKAAGAKFILRHQRELSFDEMTLIEPFSVFEEKTIIQLGLLSFVTLESIPSSPRELFFEDEGDVLPSGYFREQTTLSSYPEEYFSITKILSNN